VTFRSALVPPYVRKTMTLEAALPWLYLKGVSSGEMGAALKALLPKGFLRTQYRASSAFGPRSIKAGGMNLWVTINGFMSGRTVRALP